MLVRSLQTSLLLTLDLFPAVLLTGARQTGKTTLARSLWPDATYVSLDDPVQAAAANLEPDRFLRGFQERPILDEIQYAPGLLPRIAKAIDQDRRAGRFLLVGSASPAITGAAIQSLAGHAAVFSLPPLCLDEVVTAADGPAAANFLWRSGFPELWDRPELDRDLWLGRYVTAYLERDVRQALNVDDLAAFDRLLRAAALRAGQLLSYTQLARDAGVSPNTAKRWLAVLEATQQVFLLKPYHRQGTRRLIKAPKLYFADTGLLTFLLGIRRQEEVPGHPLGGSLWEHFVISETRKRLMAQALAPAIWFWRTAYGDEVDLLVETGPDTFVAVDCKAAERVTAADLKGLNRLAAEYGPASLTRALIVCRTEAPHPLDGDSPFDAKAVPLAGPGGLLAELAG
jgi:predicted AAA+ superfamily ATPase